GFTPEPSPFEQMSQEELNAQAPPAKYRPIGDSLLQVIPENIENYYLILWVPNDAVSPLLAAYVRLLPVSSGFLSARCAYRCSG
ncbi:hypothetical protein O5254_27470, partial [Escherichia coli]|nr:hypothetical protein [Escherichia coli]